METLPLFPLNTVLFPAMPLALHIFEERYKQMVERCIQDNLPFGVVLIREGQEVGAPAVPFNIGTSAHIVSVEKLPEGRMNLIVVGRQRFRLLDVSDKLPHLTGRVEYAPHRIGERIYVVSAADAVRRLFMAYLQLMATLSDAALNIAALPTDEASLAYAVATALQVENGEKQEWLAADSVQDILQSEAHILPREITRLRMLSELQKDRKQAAKGRIGPFSKN